MCPGVGVPGSARFPAALCLDNQMGRTRVPTGELRAEGRTWERWEKGRPSTAASALRLACEIQEQAARTGLSSPVGPEIASFRRAETEFP